MSFYSSRARVPSFGTVSFVPVAASSDCDSLCPQIV
jgi:hypothetical protein